MTIVQVTHQWDDHFGPCYDCGEPAAYAAPDMFGGGLSSHNLLCAVCAAYNASDGNGRLVYLWHENPDELTREDRAVWDFYNPQPQEFTITKRVVFKVENCLSEKDAESTIEAGLERLNGATMDDTNARLAWAMSRND